jgi:uncharacterized protein (DUF58 family)
MFRSRLIYLALLIAAFIFSQALYDSISLFTLVVVLLIPLISLLFLLCSLALVRIKVEPLPARVERLEQFGMKLHIRSKTPLLLPMMKIFFQTSSPEGDRSMWGYSIVSFRPFGQTTVELPVCFKIRGYYSVGVDYVYFYDILRLFRIKRRIGKKVNVTVSPRKLQMTLALSPSVREQENTVTAGGRETKNGGDISGIRDFNNQDTLRQVHWKLSARLSKMIVKTYWENTATNIMVLVDLFSYEQEHLLNRRLTDGVVEIALQASKTLAEGKVRATLGYPSYDEILCKRNISTIESQVKLSDELAMSPMMEKGLLEQTLCELDFTALQGGALYVISSMKPEELEKCVRPHIYGLDCDFKCIALRPQAEGALEHIQVVSLAELEGEVV